MGRSRNVAYVATWPGVRSPRSSARSDSSAVTISAFSSLIAAVRTRTAPALVTAWTRIASRTPPWARGTLSRLRLSISRAARMASRASDLEPSFVLRTRLVARLHALAVELSRGGIAKRLNSTDAAKFLATVTPTDPVAELTADIAGLEAQIKRSECRIRDAVRASGTTLTDIFGIGPVIAAMLIALHLAAMIQLRHRDSDGRANFERRIAEGKTGKEAIRALKRQLSNVVYRHLVTDGLR